MDFQIVPVAEASVKTVMLNIDKVVINPIIIFMFAVALVYFLFGVVQYFMSPGSEEVRKTSKTHMLWGVIGLFIMVGVFGIMKLVIGTLGVTNIKINNNGNYTIDDPTTLADKNVADSTKSNQDLFTKPLNLSQQNTSAYLEATFTTIPFATYKENASCWHRPIYDTAATEYDALSLIKNEARTQYLHDNGIATDSNLDMPIIYQTQVLYDKTHALYYAWVDARAPINGGTKASCKLDVIEPAPALPDPTISIDMRDGTDYSMTNVPKAQISDFTADPFPNNYIERPNVCWHQDIPGKGSTEYLALQDVKQKARAAYITANGLSNLTADPKLPTVFGVLTGYDAPNKMYYAWWDARAPVGSGKASDCNLLEQIDSSSRSTKPNPLIGYYVSDALYYRVVDSGVDSTYVGARSAAIHNGLLQLAALMGVTDTSHIVYRVLPEEKYYPIDKVTGNYDYWLALEAKRQ